MNKVKEPNFFIVGAAKSGTTSLYNYIGQHPDLYFSPIKEPAHFVRNLPYERYSDIGSYLSLFKKAGNAKAIGEASTGYLFDKDAASLIHDKFPSAKIIIILRNPSEMVFSFWRYEQACGDESSTFEYVISDAGIKDRRSDAFKKSCRDSWWADYVYMDRGLYFEQVRRYVDVFGRDNLRVYIFERLIKDPKLVCSDIFKFLGIDSGFVPDYSKVYNKTGRVRSKFFRKIIERKYPLLRALLPTCIKSMVRSNVSSWNIGKAEKKEMSVSAREYLENFFSSDIKNLEKLMGEEIKEWESKL